MTVPLVRKRARRPKVRTGCRTCRARHIKCDEEKPTCRNCAISGKECAGYDVVKPPVRARLPLLQPNEEAKTIVPSVMYDLSTLLGGLRSTEGYALDFFLHRAFQDLPGSSWTLSWEKLILPYCRTEPAILQAAMAIGSLQQGISPGSGQLNSALLQYGKAAGMVRHAIERYGQVGAPLDVESVLTACLLLFCFEILHDQDVNASMHLRNGLKILHEHVGAPPTNALLPTRRRPIEMQVSARSRLEVLTQTFVRLDADISMLGDDDSFLSPICRTPVPNSFDSLDEAMVHLDAMQSLVYRIGCELDKLAEIELERIYPGYEALDGDLTMILTLAASRTVSIENVPRLQVRMEEARQALRSLMAALASLPSSSDQPDPHRLLVEIHLFFVWFDASVWRDSDELEMDRFDEQFAYILGLCERYFTSDQAHNSNSPNLTRPSFAMGTCVGQTVCLIVEKSRNSLLRRRGINLISRMDMRGVFDGAFLASFYQHVVDTEERKAREILGLPEGYVFHFNEIPAGARFVEVDVSGVDECDDMFYHKEVGRMVFVVRESGELRVGEEVFGVRRPFSDADRDSNAWVSNVAEGSECRDEVWDTSMMIGGRD